ncbi:MAG TPA: PilX N-terminal domain-containing pilus assembly protein [Steroidobacteraceae bacterium]|nr:PilX N-terminal domain-containing pilus assembly protein [Steroidobacteraceae bacterium]
MNTGVVRHTRGERGASLIVALIFLVIMAMLGVTVASVTGLEQRMASNTRDRDLALQAAEAALHDAQERLKGAALRGDAVPFVKTRENSASFWDACFANRTAPCDKTHEPEHKLVNFGPGAVAAQPLFVVEKKDPIGTTEIYLVTARAVGGTADTVVILQAEYAYTPVPAP